HRARRGSAGRGTAARARRGAPGGGARLRRGALPRRPRRPRALRDARGPRHGRAAHPSRARTGGDGGRGRALREGRAVTATETSSEASPTTDGGAASGNPPNPRRRVGIVLLWVAIVLVVVIGGLAVWAAGQTSRSGQHDRSPVDPSERGAMALAQVLGQQGVDVTITHSFWETEVAVGDGRDVTLLVDDDWWVVAARAGAGVLNLSQHLIVVQPTDVGLEQLTPGVESAGSGGGELPADCDLPAVQRAESVNAGGDAYTAPASAERCFASGDDGYGLVRIERGSRIVTLLGLGEVLENQYVTDSGNAALALGLLGEQPKLVWYQPDMDDLAFDDANS